MQNGKQSIPLEIAKLMAGHSHHTLMPHERAQLDQWLEASEENIEMFEDFMDMADRPVQPHQDPDMEEDERTVRYIIELILKHVERTITKKEWKILQEWASTFPAIKTLLKEIPQTNDLEELYHWLVDWFDREQHKVHLN